MPKRARASSPALTDAQIATVLAMFNKGDTQRFIALQMGLTEPVIKDILRKHKVAKNVPVMNSLQEEALAKYLTRQNNLRGGFPALRELVEKWAQDHNCSFAFSFSWRRNFLKRHQSRLPENMKKLLSTRPRDETLDANLEMNDAEEEMVDEEPAEEDMNVEWRIVNEEPDQQTTEIQEIYQAIPVPEINLSEEERAELAEAVEIAMKAFDRAGVPDVRARNLLRNMSVPGFGQPDAPRKVGPRRQKPQKWVSPAVVVEPIAKPPVKKTPLQLRVLEREYAKNQHLSGAPAEVLARKLNLTLESVLAWYRNRRQKRVIKKK